MKVPLNLIFPDSEIQISFEPTVRYNHTSSCIVIEGTRGGFLSLANCLIYLANSLEDAIDLAELPFVNSQIRLTLKPDEDMDDRVNGVISRVSDTEFIWKMSETSSSGIFCLIHSLGQLNSELHLDYELPSNELSIYCVVLEHNVTGQTSRNDNDPIP